MSIDISPVRTKLGHTGTDFLTCDAQQFKRFFFRHRHTHGQLIWENFTGSTDLVRYFDKIHNLAQLCDINPTDMTFFTGCLTAEKIYRSWCQQNQIRKPFNLVIVSYWEHFVKTASSVAVPDDFSVPVIKPKKFLSVFRSHKQHRQALHALLRHEDLSRHGLLSYDSGVRPDWNFLRGQLRDQSLIEVMQSSLDRPYENSDQAPVCDRYLLNKDINLFQDTYFSLVSESVFFEDWPQGLGWQNNLSEKIFAPILMRHAFVVLAFPGALSLLRGLGYETFHPHIDESYDHMLAPALRLRAVVKEVKRLCAFTDQQWLSWLGAVRPIIEHNHKLLQSRCQPQDFQFARIS